MSIIQGTSKSSAATYEIDQSIRFNDDDSAYLEKTFASAGDRQKWTWSAWIKLSGSTARQIIFGAAGGPSYISINENATGSAFFNLYNAGWYWETAAKYRDPSAWYHLVWAFDTTNANAISRMRFYVNGSEVTDYSTKYATGSQNASGDINNNVAHRLGRHPATTHYYDGYLTEINFVDGQQLDPTSFGETNSNTGQWVPIEYTGSYGTNGFYITGANSADLGADDSGNGNNFTSSGLAAADQVSDSPTDTYVTLNPLQKGSNVTLSDGNLVADCGSGSSSTRAFATASMPNSGKWTFQIEAVSSTLAGTDSISSIGIITNPEATNTDVTTGSKIGQTTNQENAGLDFYNGFTKKDNASQITAAQLRNAGDKGIVAYDASTKELWIGYAQSTDSSWTWVGGGNPETGTTPTYTMTNDDMRFAISSDRSKTIVRFGSTGDGIAPPSGFNYLNTANLPDPTIADPTDYFQTVLDTGANIKTTAEALYTDQLEWIKDRANANNHQLIDSVRGTSAVLQSNTTGGETTYSAPSGNSVGWVWKANGTGSSNTDGSITSTVSADTTSGFSIATYTGTGSAATVGHGLSAAPKVIISKSKFPSDWYVLHTDIGAGNSDYLIFNNTGAAGQYGALDVFNATLPTSSVFSLGTSANTNGLGTPYIAYCFAEVEGFSKFGSFTGNGSSTDGPFIYTGFTPEFFMWKRTNSSTYGDWTMMDTARDPFNMAERNLRANSTIADDTGEADLDFVSNGIKHRGGASARFNQSGATYIYMAFAETPFKTATAR